MKTIKNGELLYLKSDKLEAPHLFTTRLGGVSTDCFSSLNLSFMVGDEREAVLENMSRVARTLSFKKEDIVCSRQAHTTVCKRVGKSERGIGVVRERFSQPADALVTNEEDVLLLVRCADCTPVLLWDSATGAVAAIHSGWRGTLSNIIKSSIETMSAEFGTKAENIKAAVGSCISECCFEVGEDVATDFDEKGYGAYVSRKGEKPHVDLKGICVSQLCALGVDESNIDVSEDCTKCMSNIYFSHRAQGEKRGLLAAVIGIKRKT